MGWKSTAAALSVAFGSAALGGCAVYETNAGVTIRPAVQIIPVRPPISNVPQEVCDTDGRGNVIGCTMVPAGPVTPYPVYPVYPYPRYPRYGR